MYVCTYVCMIVCMCVGMYVYVYLFMYVCMYICIYSYVSLILNTHLPILIQRSGRAEGYAATLCSVLLYATVSTVYSQCVYIFLGYLKRRI